MSRNTSSAVMQQRVEPHDSLDYFPTPPWATRALIEELRLRGADFSKQRCWEPACGAGDMARPLAEYFETVFASDIEPQGFGQRLDFLWHYDGPAFDWIITNPPFRLAAQFALMMIERAARGCAILVRTSFLEGQERHRELFRPSPPALILQFTERVPMVKGRLDPDASSATSYCWLVWSTRPHKPVPMDVPDFGWIPPCRKRLEIKGNYAPLEMLA